MSGVHVFGVRHLSPAAGYHVGRFLDGCRPDAVLIEAPCDMTDRIPSIVDARTKPPVSVLAFTLAPPVGSVLYPLAVYSPEYQAMKWAARHKRPVRCIDLPSASVLAFSLRERERLLAAACGEEAEEPETDVYTAVARADGELTHEDWWERNFESIADTSAFVAAMAEYGRRIRGAEKRGKYDEAYNAVREAHMKRVIRKAFADGAETVAVICGAYHAPALEDYESGAMTDAELAALPRAESDLTVMPYAYSRLSSRTGYGAGNKAPAYYAMLFDELKSGTTEAHAARYLTGLAAAVRGAGGVKSSAEVIDATRLAAGLAALHGGRVPVLRDLRDAAAIVLGGGSFAPLAEAAATVEIGADIGSLPEGVSRTAVQEDFYRSLRELKLTKYQSQIAGELELDLRENNRAKTEASAFLDLERSRFLHRLSLASVSFAVREEKRDAAAWSERWLLRWTPEAEIELAESSLLGDTVEAAAAYAVKEALEKCASVAEAALLVDSCVLAGLDESLVAAASALQGLSVDACSFTEIADTLFTLSRIRRYGDLRRTDTAALLPLLSQLFYRQTLLLEDAAGCAADAAPQMLEAVLLTETVAQKHFDEVNEAAWLGALARLSERDDLNALLSGYACAVLVDRGLVDGPKLSAAVCRRLSPGTPADIGAAWFEGLSKKNRYALIARQSLWESLDAYVESLDKEEFKRAVVFLRRAFSDYSPKEKAMIAEDLGRVWGVTGSSATDALSRDLSEEESQALCDALEGFDFGDL